MCRLPVGNLLVACQKGKLSPSPSRTFTIYDFLLVLYFIFEEEAKKEEKRNLFITYFKFYGWSLTFIDLVAPKGAVL